MQLHLALAAPTQPLAATAILQLSKNFDEAETVASRRLDGSDQVNNIIIMKACSTW